MVGFWIASGILTVLLAIALLAWSLARRKLFFPEMTDGVIGVLKAVFAAMVLSALVALPVVAVAVVGYAIVTAGNYSGQPVVVRAFFLLAFVVVVPLSVLWIGDRLRGGDRTHMGCDLHVVA